MTRDKKKTNAYAKGLLKISLENGQFSEERASAVLQSILKNPQRNESAVLKEFLRLVKREVANNTASVEHAGELSSSAIEAIGAKFSAHYGRSIKVECKQNDSLIAGLRVRVGCDVYDSSVAGTLKELQATLS